jgi:hypothetical protein
LNDAGELLQHGTELVLKTILAILPFVELEITWDDRPILPCDLSVTCAGQVERYESLLILTT